MIRLLAVLAVLALIVVVPILLDNGVEEEAAGELDDDKEYETALVELDDDIEEEEYQPPPAWSADQVRAYAEPLRARLDAALAADTGAGEGELNAFTDFYDWNNQPATWGGWLP